MDNVAKDIARAERDNDLIYHQDVPAHSALPEIVIASLIPKIEPPAGLTQIHTLISDDQVLFKDLLAWAAREAISMSSLPFHIASPCLTLHLDIYNDRKQNLIEERIISATRDLDELVSQYEVFSRVLLVSP